MKNALDGSMTAKFPFNQLMLASTCNAHARDNMQGAIMHFSFCNHLKDMHMLSLRVVLLFLNDTKNENNSILRMLLRTFLTLLY